MSQDPNYLNNIIITEDSEEKDEDDDVTERTIDVIEQTNNILEDINHNFRIRRARTRLLDNLRLDRSNSLNRDLIRNQMFLDESIERRRNLRQELENNRCNYVTELNTFCTRRKTNDSIYCIYHNNEFNGRNYSLDPQINPNLNRRRRQIHHIDESNLNLNSSSILLNVTEEPSNIDISSNLNVTDHINLNVTESSNNLNVIIPNILDLPFNPPPLRRFRSYRNAYVANDVRGRPHLNVSGRAHLNISSLLNFGSPLDANNLFNFVSSQVRPIQNLDNLAQLKKNKSKNGKCVLCKKTIVDPKVVLNCDHKYHLKCYMILNTDEDNKYDIMEKCMECEKPIDLNIPESKDCSICLEKLIDDDIEIELPCKHRFHVYCIQRWVDINKNCPLCRKTF